VAFLPERGRRFADHEVEGSDNTVVKTDEKKMKNFIALRRVCASVAVQRREYELVWEWALIFACRSQHPRRKQMQYILTTPLSLLTAIHLRYCFDPANRTLVQDNANKRNNLYQKSQKIKI
jgi:hypothetical protein